MGVPHLRTAQEPGRPPDARTAAVLVLLVASGALPNLRPADPLIGERDDSGVIAAAVHATAAALTSARAS